MRPARTVPSGKTPWTGTSCPCRLRWGCPPPPQELAWTAPQPWAALHVAVRPPALGPPEPVPPRRGPRQVWPHGAGWLHAVASALKQAVMRRTLPGQRLPLQQLTRPVPQAQLLPLRRGPKQPAKEWPPGLFRYPHAPMPEKRRYPLQPHPPHPRAPVCWTTWTAWPGAVPQRSQRRPMNPSASPRALPQASPGRWTPSPVAPTRWPRGPAWTEPARWRVLLPRMG